MMQFYFTEAYYLYLVKRKPVPFCKINRKMSAGVGIGADQYEEPGNNTSAAMWNGQGMLHVYVLLLFW